MKNSSQSGAVWLPVLLSFLISSCSAFENCICTTEFRAETVLIIDNQNNPVDNLKVEITDRNNKQFNIQQNYFPESGLL